ncbi:MAG: glycosyltransferase [Subtercola sp.]|nr:glycosyltransferase [Subtercola sp.]
MTQVAVITLASAARLDHAQAQWAALDDSAASRRYVVWLDEQPPPRLAIAEPPTVLPEQAPALPEPGPALSAPAPAGQSSAARTPPTPAEERAPRTAPTIIHLPPGRNGMRLAAGRNAGARAALADGADLLVFLDADCVPAPQLLQRYLAASLAHPDAVLCGPVTYLPKGFGATTPSRLYDATNPHAARPNPRDLEYVVAGAADYRLFWSLSFATTSFTWHRAGGFAEEYEGYGGEDTDFAATLAERGVPLVWVGGAHAYHQYHATASPPWQHLDDILRNAELYHSRWGQWPMEGWLRQFAEAGAIAFVDGRWRRVAGLFDAGSVGGVIASPPLGSE